MTDLQPERLLLLFVHLLLCAFALQRVLSTDLRVLRGNLQPDELAATHRVVLRLLAGLWLSGLALASIDLGFDPTLLAGRPKLACKLATAGALTANGVLLRRYCFPRLVSGQRLARAEATLVVCAGAVSTSTWLLAAFLGIARPLQAWPLPALLALCGGVVGGAVVVALVVVPHFGAVIAPARRRSA
jgi:hypothetical protein